MTQVKSIAPRDLKVLNNWKKAPVGALLQVCDLDGAVLVGMRCELKTHGIPRPYLLVLDGTNRGLFMEADDLLDPALDVSLLLEMRIENPSPTAFTSNHRAIPGIVCEAAAGSGFLFVQAMTANRVRAYVWLVDPTGNTPTGAAQNDVPPDPIVVGLIETADKP
jgi:hypothetical protein